MTQAFTQGEPNLINDPIDVSSYPSLSLPETLSIPSAPSFTHNSQTPIPPNFSINLDARYRENSTNNIQLRLDWNTFVATPPLFGQHHESHRLHNWALNRLEDRQDIHKDIQDHNIQILRLDNLTLKFEITVKLNNIVYHPLPLAPSDITAQSLPAPFITTDVIYKYDRYKKRKWDISPFITHIQDYRRHVPLKKNNFSIFQNLIPTILHPEQDPRIY